METGLSEVGSARYYGRTDCIHNSRRYPGRNHRSAPETHSSTRMGTAKGTSLQVSRLARAEQHGSCDSISVDTCGRYPGPAATGDRSYIAATPAWKPSSCSEAKVPQEPRDNRSGWGDCRGWCGKRWQSRPQSAFEGEDSSLHVPCVNESPAQDNETWAPHITIDAI